MEKYFYCNSENCLHYYAEMPDIVGCKAEDAGDIKDEQITEDKPELKLCPYFIQN